MPMFNVILIVSLVLLRYQGTKVRKVKYAVLKRNFNVKSLKDIARNNL